MVGLRFLLHPGNGAISAESLPGSLQQACLQEALMDNAAAVTSAGLWVSHGVGILETDDRLVMESWTMILEISWNWLVLPLNQVHQKRKQKQKQPQTLSQKKRRHSKAFSICRVRAFYLWPFGILQLVALSHLVVWARGGYWTSKVVFIISFRKACSGQEDTPRCKPCAQLAAITITLRDNQSSISSKYHIISYIYISLIWNMYCLYL